MVSPRAVLATAVAAQAAVSLVQVGLPAIGLDLRREYGLGLAELGAVLTANLLGAGLALIVAGVAVDRFGVRIAMLSGASLACGGLAAAAFAPASPLLLAGLALSGAGSAVVPVAGAGVLFRVYEPGRRAWALGVRQMAVPLGGMLAAALLPALAALGGVRLALLAGGGVVGVACTCFALVAGGERSARERSSAGMRSIWRAPGMQRLLVVAALYIVVLQALLVYAVPAARAAGLSSFAAGATFLAINATAMVARVAWGRVADRHGGTRRVRTLADAGRVAAVGGVLFALALHSAPALLIPAAVVFAFGALGWNALVYVSAGERTPPELAGRSVAVAATLVFVLSALATPPLGALAERAGWEAFWLATAIVAAAGAAVAARIPALRPESAAPE